MSDIPRQCRSCGGFCGGGYGKKHCRQQVRAEKAQPAPADEQIVKHYNVWLDSLEVQANFDDYPAFEAGYRAALQGEK